MKIPLYQSLIRTLSTCRALCTDLKLIGNLMSEQQHWEREMDIYENCSNRYWTYHLATFVSIDLQLKFYWKEKNIEEKKVQSLESAPA